MATLQPFCCTNCESAESVADEDGVVTCRLCGVESQDYLPMSKDAEDSGNIYVANRTVSSHAKGARRVVQRKSAGTDLYGLLLAYQTSLQVLLRAALPLALPDGYDHTQALLQHRLKGLWDTYLLRWQLSPASCDLASAFCKRIECDCGSALQHPQFPTRALLLGFLYLSFRLERLDILPCDLVRWCERGLLPYCNLWEALPEPTRAPIDKRHRALFFEQHGGKLHFVSPANLWFQTCALAKDLQIAVPPLNAPLVARGLMASLGLPSQVWTRYADIAQLFSSGTPLQGAEAVGQHYGASVMATVLLAVMLCEGWQHWTLCHYDPSVELSAVPHLTSIYELGLLTRDEVRVFVGQARRCNHDVRTTNRKGHAHGGDQTFAFNRPVLRVLGSVVSDLTGDVMVNHGDGQEGAFNATNWPSVLGDRCRRPSEAMVGHSAAYRMLAAGKRSYEHKLTRPKVSRAMRAEGYVPYVSYARNADDATGLFHMHYVALIERAARHLYVEPLVLHRLVERLDGQVVQLAVEGRVSQPFYFSTLQRKRQRVLWQQRQRAERSDRRRMDKGARRAADAFAQMRESAERVLPVVQALGVSDLLDERGQDYWQQHATADARRFYADQLDFWESGSDEGGEGDDSAAGYEDDDELFGDDACDEEGDDGEDERSGEGEPPTTMALEAAQEDVLGMQLWQSDSEDDP